MEDNAFGTEVFLNWLRDPAPEVFQRRHWLAHQQMQFSFLLQRGLHCADRVLDVGCGPMRLGSVLLPFLTHGWYFGQDINPETLRLGETVLQRLGVSAERCTLIASDDFSFAGVEDHSIDLAFSNSLFSHLSLNSILRCLLAVAAKLKPDGRFYSTFFCCPQAATGSSLAGAINGALSSSPILASIRSTTARPCLQAWLVMPVCGWNSTMILAIPRRPWLSSSDPPRVMRLISPMGGGNLTFRD